MRRLLLILAPLFMLALGVHGATAQTCSSRLCPNGAPAQQVDDKCMCGDQAYEGDLGPSCATDFACPSASQVPYGDWPVCLCRKADDLPKQKGVEGPPHFGGEIPFHPGLGGVDVCNQFLECPKRTKMAVDDDTCVCRR